MRFLGGNGCTKFLKNEASSQINLRSCSAPLARPSHANPPEDRVHAAAQAQAPALSPPASRPIHSGSSPRNRPNAIQAAVPQASRSIHRRLIARVKRIPVWTRQLSRATLKPRAEFRLRFNQLLAAIDLRSSTDDRLERELDVSSTHQRLGASALQQGDGFAEQKSEPAHRRSQRIHSDVDPTSRQSRSRNQIDSFDLH